MRPIKQNEKFKLHTFQEKRRIMSGWSKRRVPLLTRKIRTRTATWTGLSLLSGSYLRTCLLMRTRPSTSLRYLSPSNYWIWIKAWISSLWYVYPLGARFWSNKGPHSSGSWWRQGWVSVLWWGTQQLQCVCWFSGYWLRPLPSWGALDVGKKLNELNRDLFIYREFPIIGGVPGSENIC